MRLAMLGYYHETNTFSVTPTPYESFVRDGILRGDEIVQQHATAQSSLTGYLDAGQEPGVEVVPLVFTTTGPSLRPRASSVVSVASKFSFS